MAARARAPTARAPTARKTPTAVQRCYPAATRRKWRCSSSPTSRSATAPSAALRGVDLYVEEGEIVALLGANGAGKTTTLRTISGLVHPSSGTIRFDGCRSATCPPMRW